MPDELPDRRDQRVGGQPEPAEPALGPAPDDAELVAASDAVLLSSTEKVRQLASEGVLQRVLGKVANWGRRSSLWPLMFGTACCFVEMAATAAGRYDLSRFGSEVMRASPRQADLMIVPGTVTKKMVPFIVRLYHQMAEPKWVIAMGACATSGGPFKEGYNVVSGIDEFIPVDIYVPGCPPKPEALMFALMKLQEKIDAEPLISRRDTSPERYPVPALGPDLIDVSRLRDLPRELDIARHQHAAPVAEDGARKPRPIRAEPAPAPGLAPGQLQVSGPADALDALRGALGDLEDATESDSGPLVLSAERLREVFAHLKDGQGFDYLSNLTSVDYPDRFEVVYHAFSTASGGPPIELKVAVARQDPKVPSVVDLYRSADFQEREVYDMMGIRFEGHPSLQRILLWEEFEGYPLRKDYHEPYFESPAKPFDSRWPTGRHVYAEERNPFGRNVRYPADWDPAGWREQPEDLPVVDAGALSAGPIAQQLVISFGPQHPSTHGVFRMVTTLQGETVVKLEPVMGYLHRNHEKIAERNTYIQVMPFTDRLDYISSMANNLAYALAVEKLMGLQVPERAEYIRVIMVELTRIVNHFLALGTYLNDIGAFFTPVIYAFEEREHVLDLFEMTAGSRMMCNYMRFGGVARDLPDEFLPLARELVDTRLPKAVDEFDRYLTGNEILLARSRGVGTLSREMAVSSGVTGPLLRASGVPYDVRRAEPYSIYDRFDFDVPVGTQGDTYDRFVVRLEEMRQSLRILRQALDDIPDGEVLAGKKLWQVRVPKGEAYARTESPKGELGIYVVSDGSPNPYRYHVRAPSFVNLTALEAMCIGERLADVIAIFGSIDINMGEVDR